jgi:DNA-binding NtrC family response regulator
MDPDRCVAAVHEILLAAGSGPVRRVDLTDLSPPDVARLSVEVGALAERLGFLPVDTSQVAESHAVAAQVAGRSVVAVHDVAGPGSPAALVRLALAGARLAAVVRVHGSTGSLSDYAREGRTAWWPAGETRRAATPRAAAPAALLVPGAPAFGPAAPILHPSDAIGVKLARRMDRASALLAVRRRAAACRELRAVVELGDGTASLAALAGRAGAALSAQWLDDGRPATALREARRAAASALRGGDHATLLAAGVLLGHAWLELAEPATAERVLSAVVEAVRDNRGALAEAATAALVRCLLWRGETDRASQLLTQQDAAADRGEAHSLPRWRARAALARGDLVEVGRWLACDQERGAASARVLQADLARRTGQFGDAAAALAALAREPHVQQSCSLGARVACLRLHVAADAGERDAVTRLAADAARRRRRTHAPLLGARLDLALEAAGLRRAGRARAIADTRGLPGLLPNRMGGTTVLDELLELLGLCHEHAADLDVLTRICERLRARFEAGAVRVVEAGTRRTLAGAGGPPGPGAGVADRAIATGRIVEPVRVGDGLEAAGPVRYAGEILAVIACRWPGDAHVGAARVAALLTAATSAAGPFVQDALDRAEPPPSSSEDLGLVGASSAMERLRDAVRRAAPVGFPVLVTGESGSGKELVARAIHRLSPRRQRRCCAVNCAAITDDLLEAELFGHARGAFTGAVADRPGLFEEADGGTLFLDEVGELSARAQAKLLRVLQEGEVRRVGESLPRRVDVRVIGATNRAIEQEVELGRFRADLRYRLDVLRVTVPPLRDRPEDIPRLAAHFWDECAARTGSRARLDPRTVGILAAYHWPGNVRELQNVMATLAVHAPCRGRVGPHLLPRRLVPAPREAVATLDEARRRFDAAFVREALQRTGGRRGETARQLGLTRQGLIKLMVRLGLDSRPPGGPARSGRDGGAAA